MLEKKNIDRVFQENLKDLEIFPPKKVWNNIEQSLGHTPTKKPIAIWQSLSGVAAIFIIFMGSIWYFNSNVLPTNQHTISQTKEEPIQNPFLEKGKGNPVVLAKTPVFKKPNKKVKPVFIKNPNNNIAVIPTNTTATFDGLNKEPDFSQKELLNTFNTSPVLANAEINTAKIETVESKKWGVGPTVSPIYYNTLQNGSPVSASLAANSKTASDALSVGVKINYQLTKKIQLQSGINKVDLAYNTKDVSAFITSAKGSETKNSSVVLSPSANPENSLVSSKSTGSNIYGDLNQSIEYIEFPMEMKYNLYDKKVGLNVVGGFSTFILTNNSISIISQDNITDLGEVTNLNSLNFSGNLGLDFDYKINGNWYLNVSPMLKYQFNTYSNDAGNFKPYYLGVYSGLNYKF